LFNCRAINYGDMTWCNKESWGSNSFQKERGN